MANKYLARGDAPFGDKVWAMLDATMIEAAKKELAGRRLLDVEGPYGVGLKAVPLRDKEQEDGLFVSNMLPLSLIQEPFVLATRDLANYEREGITLGTRPAFDAAVTVARREDQVIFKGTAGVPGLLTAEGTQQQALSDWSEVGTAANDIIQAVTALDDAGFHGPYSLALAPARYNLLLRLYARGNRSEIEHVRQIVTEGIVKAPTLKDGGVLIASSPQYASIVLGQDMSVGFIGPAGADVEFTVSESLVPRIRRPEAICILEG